VRNVSRFLSRAALALSILLLVAGMAMAQDGGTVAPPAQAQSTMTMMEFIKYGGTVGHLVILVSVVCLGMSIERGIGLKRDNIVPPDVLAQLEQLFEEEEYEEAMTVCESQPCPLTNTVAAGLAKVGTNYDNIKGSTDESMDLESVKLIQSISYINLLSVLAPMLGLFGTVTGMIAAFDQIARSATPPTPAQLAGGIQQALVTTCQGLMVAMPFNIVYFVFRNKVQKITLELASIVGELFDRFKE
jgi:biopolymer transport protein ExbB